MKPYGLRLNIRRFKFYQIESVVIQALIVRIKYSTKLISDFIQYMIRKCVRLCTPLVNMCSGGVIIIQHLPQRQKPSNVMTLSNPVTESAIPTAAASSWTKGNAGFTQRKIYVRKIAKIPTGRKFTRAVSKKEGSSRGG
jgi:hypothetical protein